MDYLYISPKAYKSNTLNIDLGYFLFFCYEEEGEAASTAPLFLFLLLFLGDIIGFSVFKVQLSQPHALIATRPARSGLPTVVVIGLEAGQRDADPLILLHDRLL